MEMTAEEEEVEEPGRGPPADRTGLLALANGTRRRILGLLGRGDLTINELAETLGRHRATVRHHVEHLLAAGLIQEVEWKPKKRPGRPPVRYSVKQGVTLPGYPPRQYQMLAEISLEALLRSLGEDETAKLLREIARDRGRQMIRGIRGAALGEAPLDSEAFKRYFVFGSLQEMGMEVDVLSSDRAHVHFRMRPCPFQELAEVHTDLICDNLDRGFHEGMLEGMDGQVKVRRFACMGHGDAHCEYAFQWAEAQAEVD